MRKRVIAALMAGVMATALLVGCGGGSSASSGGGDAAAQDTQQAASSGSGDKVINLWSFTEEVPGMVQKYIETHPDFGYTVNTTVIATTEGAYQPALDQALPYKDLGIDIDKAIADAKIAQYAVDIGTNADGDVDGLGYQATGGAFIYRRSIAKDVFGTDDPTQIAEILGAGTNSWDKFWEAAAKLAENNVAIVSGDGDVWHAVENSSETGWINAEGQLHIDPKREAFLDISKSLIDNGWSNATQDWQDAWFADMKGQGAKPVFGFFGPAWLINYTLAPNCGGSAPGEGTYGDWAVCAPPIGFFWGGTWVMANKNMDPEKVAAVSELINWITLDTTEDGLQYKWANGTLNGEGGTKDAAQLWRSPTDLLISLQDRICLMYSFPQMIMQTARTSHSSTRISTCTGEIRPGCTL